MLARRWQGTGVARGGGQRWWVSCTCGSLILIPLSRSSLIIHGQVLPLYVAVQTLHLAADIFFLLWALGPRMGECLHTPTEGKTLRTTVEGDAHRFEWRFGGRKKRTLGGLVTAAGGLLHIEVTIGSYCFQWQGQKLPIWCALDGNIQDWRCSWRKCLTSAVIKYRACGDDPGVAVVLEDSK